MKQTRLVKILLGGVASAAAFDLALAQADVAIVCGPVIKKKSTCFVVDDDGTTSAWVCTKHKDNTWSCVSATKETPRLDLRKAVLAAKGRKHTEALSPSESTPASPKPLVTATPMKLPPPAP